MSIDVRKASAGIGVCLIRFINSVESVRNEGRFFMSGWSQ